MPGSGATQIVCKLFARSDSRWECLGRYSTGSNQGYYQENYGYGPWEGLGKTPEGAISHMLARVDQEFIGQMRQAAHDALMERDKFDATFASLAAKEVERLESLLNNGEREDSGRCTIAGVHHYGDLQFRTKLRQRAVKILKRYATGQHDIDLSSISDAAAADGWCDIGVWEASVAAQLRDAGLIPSQVDDAATALTESEKDSWSQLDETLDDLAYHESQYTDGCPIYSVCNNDTSIDVLIDVAKTRIAKA